MISHWAVPGFPSRLKPQPLHFHIKGHRRAGSTGKGHPTAKITWLGRRLSSPWLEYQVLRVLSSSQGYYVAQHSGKGDLTTISPQGQKPLSCCRPEICLSNTEMQGSGWQCQGEPQHSKSQPGKHASSALTRASPYTWRHQVVWPGETFLPSTISPGGEESPGSMRRVNPKNQTKILPQML